MFPINRHPRQPFQVDWWGRAQKEGSGDPDDQLHKTTRRVTWAESPSPARQENYREVVGDTGNEPAAALRSQSVGELPIFGRRSKPEYEMTNAHGLSGTSNHSIDEGITVIERRVPQPQSEELKARRRFVAKFFKHQKDEPDSMDEDRSKNRPWYRGKKLRHRPFTIRNQLLATVFNSWINLLLFVVPVGFVLNYVNANPVAVFFVNFVAILPMAGLLGYAMDELRLRVGDIVGALIYMSFGNIVQLITSIFLLRSRQIGTLKTSLIGGILTLILLNNGVAFFFGGLRRSEQYYNTLVATVFNSLLSVSTAAFVIPTASYYLSATSIPTITAQSRGTAIVLIVVYALYLYFELKTHADGFLEESRKVAMRPRKRALPEGAIAKALAKAGGVGAGVGRAQLSDRGPNDELLNETWHADWEDEEPRLHLYVCIAILVIGTTILAFNTQFMTDSIEGLTRKAVPRDFIGMVLLPILSNDAMAVQSASKDQMDLAIQSALGKSLQTALVVAPILVLVGWGMGIPDMNLLFDGFQVSALFVSVLLAQQCILDGKSNWLKGAILTLTYVIVAIASWFQGAQSVA